MHIGQIVSDWGGFEKLVASLHETGDVTVEHNVLLPGRSGAPRQIDVLLKHKQGLYEHLVVVECKYWNTPVERLHVDALATTVREVGAAKGVIFSTQGFQSGAKTQAQHDNIELFQVRELTDLEWGLPGKVIDFFLHVIGISIGSPSFVGAFSYTGMEPIHSNLAISMGDPEKNTKTPMFKKGEPENTLEEYLERVAHDSATKFYSARPVKFSNGTYNGKILFKGHVNVAPVEPIKLSVNGGLLLAPRIEFDVGVEVSQSRMTFDRSERYVFALAVQNCVNGHSTLASRRTGASVTTLQPSRESAPQEGDILENGSVMSVWTKGFLPFDPFAKINLGEVVEVVS